MSTLKHTPQGKPLDLPTVALQQAIESEWQGGKSGKGFDGKPYTQLAVTAIDSVVNAPEGLLKILRNDNLLYWADTPKELVAAQEQQWRPLIDAMNQRFLLKLTPSFGFHLETLDEEGVIEFMDYINALNPFQQIGLFEMASLSHSLIISWALAARRVTSAEDTWNLAQLHENFQEDHWGQDEEARAAEEQKKESFHVACRFFQLSTPF